MEDSKNIRHVLGISGGKDSAALAIYLKDKGIAPDIEYFFCDTGKELPEVYDFLHKLEAYLDKEIKILSPTRDFDHYLVTHMNYLPSARQRWCTLSMKIKPFEAYVGEDNVVSYIGIRADEHREGYISTKPNIKPVFPFKEDGIVREDVFRILEESVGIPEYYKWRSRSGCFFCFFQRKSEWLGLKENHPDLFEQAKKYEKPEEGYTWVHGATLDEVVERAQTEEYQSFTNKKEAKNWKEILIESEDDDPEEQACMICSL